MTIIKYDIEKKTFTLSKLIMTLKKNFTTHDISAKILTPILKKLGK
jgi:hypothetical protein